MQRTSENGGRSPVLSNETYPENSETRTATDKHVPAPYSYIETQPSLDKMVGRLRGARRVALDIEANSLYRYHIRVCLIQLSFLGGNYIVDPLAKLDFSDFVETLADKPLIAHGADYDLRMMRTSLGFHPRREVFDTMLAAKILGIEQIGLVALAGQLLGVSLTKKGQKSNWAQRPLTQAQLDYACDDTRFLEEIADILARDLARLGRLEWHRETCVRMVESAMRDDAVEPDPDDVWRIKGSATLDSRQLAFLRAIWHWREDEARRIDRPSFKVLGNPEVLDLAVWAAANPGRLLRDWPALPRSISGNRYDALQSVLRAANGLRRSEWPKPRVRRTSGPPEPDRRHEIEALQHECNRVAETLGVPPSLLAPRTTLAAIAKHRPRTTGELMACTPMMEWQASLLGPVFQDVINKFDR